MPVTLPAFSQRARQGQSCRLGEEGRHEYLDQCRKSFERIHAQGVLSMDVLPEQLSVTMVNRYLALKRGGSI